MGQLSSFWRRALSVGLSAAAVAGMPLSISQEALSQEVLAQDAMPSVAPESSPNPQQSIADALQVAQQRSAQGDVPAALDQLRQAVDLARALPSTDQQDYWLKVIGDRFLTLNALEQAQAVAQTMSYETLGLNDLLRVDLEKSIVRAYLQAGQTAPATDFIQSLPTPMQDQYWIVMVEELAQQGQVEEAKEALGRVVDQGYFRYLGISAINRAYIAAEQFEAAQQFLQNPDYAFADPLEQSAGLNELALWAGRANQLEQAEAIARQVPESYRVTLLVELAYLYHARGQTEPALALLAEAAQLPRPTEDRWRSFEILTNIANAYVHLGQADEARQLLEVGMAADTAQTGSSSQTEWITVFAQIGAFDRAWQLLETMEGDRHEARFSLAAAYANQGQYDSAITLVSQIPDRVLFPLPEYPDPKIELLDRIIAESMEQGQVRTAERAAQVMEYPVDQVKALVTIANAYQSRQQTEAAIATLDQALTLANTIDRYGIHIDRHTYVERSNADLLIPVAAGYWAAGESNRAIATAESAIQSVQTFSSDPQSISQSAWFSTRTLERIANLGKEWQRPDLQRSAIVTMEQQIQALMDTNPPPEILIDLLNTLGRSAHEPGQPPSEQLLGSIERLTALQQQAPEPFAQISILQTLLGLYRLTDQPIEGTVDQILPLIATLSTDLHDGNYQRLALILASPEEPISTEVIALLSSPEKQVETLFQIAHQLAAENHTEATMATAEEAIALAQTLQPPARRNAFTVAINTYFSPYLYDYFYGNPSPDWTAAEITLMFSLPQYVDNPLERARMWLEIAETLPPTEAARAYGEMSTALAAVEASDAYLRREMLWQEMQIAAQAEQFERARQIASALDGEYRQTALDWVRMAPQRLPNPSL